MLCEVMDVIVNFKNIIFIGVGLPDFREGQVEKRDKTEKCSMFFNRFLNIPLILNLALPLFLG